MITCIVKTIQASIRPCIAGSIGGVILSFALAYAVDCLPDAVPCEEFVLNGKGCSTGCPPFDPNDYCCAYTEYRCVGTTITFRHRSCNYVQQYCSNATGEYKCSLWP